jgi:hypothetical protein
MMVTTLIFFASAFMFIIRIGILMILMLTSPLYFLSFTLNFASINKIKNEWTSALQAQALFPIIFLLITYVTVVFIRTSDMFGVKGSGASLAKALTAESGSFSIIINYIIITLLMVAALKYSKSVGGDATKYGSKLSGLAMGKLSSGEAWAGRSTIGAAGGALAKSQFTRDMVNKGGFMGKTAGNLLVRGGEKAAQSSFDVRASRAYGFAEGQMGGMGAGKASDKTFAKDGSGLAGVGAMGARAAAVGARAANYGATRGGWSGKIAGGFGSVASGLGSGMQVAGGGEKASEDALKKQEAARIKEITDRYKDDPKAAEAMLRSMGGIGSARFEGKAGKEVRAKLAAQQRTTDAKNTLKDKATLADANAYDKQAHKTAKDDVKRLTAAGAPPAAISAATNKVTAMDKLEQAQQKVVAATREVKPEDVSGLDVATLETLAKTGALNAQHLKGIETLMNEGATYTAPEIAQLNAMAKDLRLNGNDTVKKYLTNGTIKGTTPFVTDFKSDLTTLVSAPAPDPRKIAKVIQAMDKQEIIDLDHSVVFDKNVLASIPPKNLAHFVSEVKTVAVPAALAALTQAKADVISGAIFVDPSRKSAVLKALS